VHTHTSDKLADKKMRLSRLSMQSDAVRRRLMAWCKMQPIASRPSDED